MRQLISKTSIKFDEFLRKASAIHGDRYQYDAVNYINGDTKVEIRCKIHGLFLQTPNSHIRKPLGAGCPLCGRNQYGKKSRLTIDEFLNRAKKIHGDKYDYSQSVYRSRADKLTIICRIHGLFQQKAGNHMDGDDCPLCARETRHSKMRSVKFIELARQKHGNTYDYSKCVYYQNKSFVTIICPKHGEFQQIPNSHLNGRGCPQCGKEAMIDSLRLDFSEFYERSVQKHGSRYDYDKSTYIDRKTKFRIICPKHGEFWQSPECHLLGAGCQKCSLSSFQLSVYQYLLECGIKPEEVVVNDRKILDGYELDLYVPHKLFAVECNGTWWHGYDRTESRREKLKESHKHDLACAAGLDLLQITDEEWYRQMCIVKSMLSHHFGLSRRIYARCCKLIIPSTEMYRKFTSANHIQGYRSAAVIYGLEYAGDLVAVMSFSTHPKYQHEIMRFCNAIGSTVIGAASKLFKQFLVDFTPERVMSFASRRYSTGAVYKHLGFKLLRVTDPNYRYTKSGKTYSRQYFQKHKLKARLRSFDQEQTESQNMFNNGYKRIWDSGQYLFLWEAPC
jgi:hypothetical protein